MNLPPNSTPNGAPVMPTRFERAAGWTLVGVAAVISFVISYTLEMPHVAQGYFLEVTMLLLAAGFGAAWALGWAEPPRRVTFPFVLIALFGLFACVAVIGAPSPLFALRQLRLPFAGFLYYAFVIALPHRRIVLERATITITLAGALLALYGLLQYFGVEFLSYSELVRKNTVIATIGHPNFLSSVLGPLVFISAALAFGRRGAWMKAGLPLAVLLLWCILLARTRAIWLGIIVGTVVLLLIAGRVALLGKAHRRLASRLVLACAIALGALVGFLAVVLPLAGRPVDLTERLGSQREIKSRFFYWMAAIDMGAERPVFGRGVGSFDPAFWDYTLAHQRSDMGAYFEDVIPAISGSNPEHVHNEYLEVLSEQGWAGLLPLLAFVVFFLQFGYLRLVREPDPREMFRQAAIYAALVVILVDALLSFPWRLPVSLVVSAIVFAWVYEFIYGRPAPAAIAPSA